MGDYFFGVSLWFHCRHPIWIGDVFRTFFGSLKWVFSRDGEFLRVQNLEIWPSKPAVAMVIQDLCGGFWIRFFRHNQQRMHQKPTVFSMRSSLWDPTSSETTTIWKTLYFNAMKNWWQWPEKMAHFFLGIAVNWSKYVKMLQNVALTGRLTMFFLFWPCLRAGTLTGTQKWPSRRKLIFSRYIVGVNIPLGTNQFSLLFSGLSRSTNKNNLKLPFHQKQWRALHTYRSYFLLPMVLGPSKSPFDLQAAVAPEVAPPKNLPAPQSRKEKKLAKKAPPKMGDRWV